MVAHDIQEEDDYSLMMKSFYEIISENSWWMTPKTPLKIPFLYDEDYEYLDSINNTCPFPQKKPQNKKEKNKNKTKQPKVYSPLFLFLSFSLPPLSIFFTNPYSPLA